PPGPVPVRERDHHRRGVHAAAAAGGRRPARSHRHRRRRSAMRGMRGRSGFGMSQFIMGLCLIVLGAFTCLRPRSIFTGIAVIYGVAAVITGICDMVIYIKEERFSGFGPMVSLVTAILSIMTGIALLAYPGIAEWIISLLFPLWFITHCISRLAHTALIRYVAGNFYYYSSLAVNILGLVLGFVMLLQP